MGARACGGASADVLGSVHEHLMYMGGALGVILTTSAALPISLCCVQAAA